MMLRKTQIVNTVVIAVILSVLMLSFGTFIVGAAEVAPVTRADAADLYQMLESLQLTIKSLEKTILLLSDRLDEITKLAGKQVVASPVPKLRSPRQIDRTPVQEEKTAKQITNQITKLKILIEDEIMEQMCIDLLTSKKSSNFVESLRAQLNGWIDTPTEERSFATPFSAKQFAWVCHLLHPIDYPNPKTIKELYPNG